VLVAIDQGCCCALGAIHQWRRVGIVLGQCCVIVLGCHHRHVVGCHRLMVAHCLWWS